MKNKTFIEFVNHASVLITHGNVSILSDPWYSDTVFNKGWRLLYENSTNYIYKILNKTSHIYISHEHPDHFSASFFLNPEIKKTILENNISILFQNTKDKRVKNFLEKNGYSVQEISKKIFLNEEVKIEIVKHDFYDSSIFIETSDLKILNLNDCPLSNKYEIKKFKEIFGQFDVLLTQFSYAAWKGNKDNKFLRITTAKDKIDAIIKQYKILGCTSVIPFASYIYFSNEMNFYMNDCINTPEKLFKELKEQNINAFILMPGEKQELSNLIQNKKSIDFWEDNFQNIKTKKIDSYDQSFPLDQLQENFKKYQKLIFSKNSKILIYALHKLKFLNIFQDINIFLKDHNKNYNYSILSGLNVSKQTDYDIAMHSESLFFIFKNEFGYDTLTVNGCFECESEKFSKVSKNLAIGSLNSMGINLNLTILFKLNIIILFLKKLVIFLRKFKRST